MNNLKIESNESVWANLAIIRFILATIVYISHLSNFTDMPVLFSTIMKLGGKSAVLGFLLISGISIGHSYQKSKEGYLTRRFLRIYPLYFFAVLFTIFVQYYIGSPYQLPEQMMVTAGTLTSIANLFFLQGFAAITITYNGPLWSIGVEVFFYLLLPLLFRLKSVFIYGLLIISMISFSLVSMYFHYGYIALVYAWPWLLGFLISSDRPKLTTYLFVIIGFMVAYINYINNNILTEDWSIIAFLTILVAVIAIININFKLPNPLTKIFNYLGALSYPLYLFHFPFYLLMHYFGLRNAYAFCGYLLLFIIPINLILDHWLSKHFWKPLVSTIYISKKRLWT